MDRVNVGNFESVYVQNKKFTPRDYGAYSSPQPRGVHGLTVRIAAFHYLCEQQVRVRLPMDAFNF